MGTFTRCSRAWTYQEGHIRKAFQKGRPERSTLPPEKTTPSFGDAPSARGGSARLATAPGFSSGAMATAEEASMMIFMRSQTRRIAEMISVSLASRMRSTLSRRIANVLGASEARRPSAMVSLDSRDRSEEHTSELQSPCNLVCRLLLEKKKNTL